MLNKQTDFQTSGLASDFLHKNAYITKKEIFYFSDQGRFFQTFALQTHASTNSDDCAQQTSRPSPTTTATDQLISEAAALSSQMRR